MYGTSQSKKFGCKLLSSTKQFCVSLTTNLGWFKSIGAKKQEFRTWIQTFKPMVQSFSSLGVQIFWYTIVNHSTYQMSAKWCFHWWQVPDSAACNSVFRMKYKIFVWNNVCNIHSSYCNRHTKYYTNSDIVKLQNCGWSFGCGLPSDRTNQPITQKKHYVKRK